MRLIRALPVLLVPVVFACNKPAAPAASGAAPAPAAAAAPNSPSANSPSAAPSAAPSGAPSGSPSAAALAAGGIHFTPPGDWTVETPSSPMRLHQLAIPGAAGATAGVVTVMGAGGTVEDNLNRWRKQFQGAPAEQLSTRTVDGLNVTLLTLTGTYLDKPAPMSPQPGIPREGWTMSGAVVEAPQGLIFIKGWGPSATMDAAKTPFETLVGTIAKD